MVQKCVVYGCSNTKDEKRGISIHQIPFFGDQRPEAKKRRRKWIAFVNVKRQNWTASKHSVICSVHFTPADFSRLSDGQKYQLRLKRDEIGVISVPSVQSVKTPEEETNRDVRMKHREVRIVIETRQSSLLYVFVGFFGLQNFRLVSCSFKAYCKLHKLAFA